jgi:MtrB/PioB family decaheme-associated outer membrane protein
MLDPRRVTVLCASALALALAPTLRAAAEGMPPPSIWGNVEAGAYLGTEDSYKFGDFTGLKDDAWYGLANVELFGRAPWTSDETWHFSLQGSNLALDSRFIDLRGGFQGLFGLYFQWDQIPKYEDDSGQLVFLGRGTTELTLPPGWVPATTTSGFTALDADLRRLNVWRDRDALRAGGKLVLPAGFELSTDYEWERREGRKIVGAAFGNTGGNPRTALLPEKRNWQTHELDSRLRYADDTRQFEIGYEHSYFDNFDDFLTWQNPFALVGGWDPSAAYPAFGRKGGAPDNRFHQVFGSGGYNLPWWKTRIAGHASFAWYRQNDDFLPFSVNPALDAPLPRGDANGAIDAANVTLRLTSRPIDRLRVTASYRLDDRDNDTERDPSSPFNYIAGDSLAQQPVDSTRSRLNLPNSYRLHEGRLDLAFEVYERTELSAGYERQREIRSWTETDELDDDIFRAGVRTRFLRWADFRIDGMYWRRDAGDYFYQAPVVWGFSREHVATVPPDERFENLPPLRKYSYTDRDRSSVDARLVLLPLETATLGFQVGWNSDEYDGSELGLRSRDALHWGVDASWSPLETLTGYAWYTQERYESQVRGRQFSNAAQAVDQTRNWQQEDFDDIDTVGVGAEWTGFEERLRLRADYAFSWAKERIDVNVGPSLAATRALPDDRTFLHDVSFTAEYRILTGLTGRFGYLFQWLDANEWAYDGVGPTTQGEVLGLGEQPPDYAAHLFAFSLIYEFDF